MHGMDQTIPKFFDPWCETEFHYFLRQYLEPQNGGLQRDTRWGMFETENNYSLSFRDARG